MAGLQQQILLHAALHVHPAVHVDTYDHFCVDETTVKEGMTHGEVSVKPGRTETSWYWLQEVWAKCNKSRF